MQPGFTINSSEAPVILQFDFVLPDPMVSMLSFAVESQANTFGLNGQVELRDFQTGDYLPVGEFGETLNSDSISMFDLSDSIARAVDPANGEVVARVGWKATGFTALYPWTVSVDAVNFSFQR